MIPRGPTVPPCAATFNAGDADIKGYEIEIEAQPTELLVLSPLNAEALDIVRKVNPGLVLIEDVFTCQSTPTVPRLTLRQAHAIQSALQPSHSVLLAPGESIDVRLK